MANSLPQKIDKQIDKAGLPRGGSVPFIPKLVNNRRGETIIEKATVQHGPKQGKRDLSIPKVAFGSRTMPTRAIRTIGTCKKTAA